MRQNHQVLKYAIGEIILVVIGIIDGASVNIGDEVRNFKMKEIGMLVVELKSNLQKLLLKF
jgi:hypothetical protein